MKFSTDTFLIKYKLFYFIPEIKEEINKGMSNITEGVCSLLSVRIEYIISSSPSPFELHDIASLLRFYVNVIGEVRKVITLFLEWYKKFCIIKLFMKL